MAQNPLRRFVNWVRKTVVVNRITTVFGTAPPTYSPNDYPSYAQEGYAKNAYIFACVLKHSVSCAGLPWGVYRVRYGARKRLDSSDLWRLMRRPNAGQTLRAFLREMVSYWDIGGEAYVLRNDTLDGARPVELLNLRPDRVTVTPGAELGVVRGYTYAINGAQPVEYPANRVMHIRSFNPLDDWHGMSPIKAASRSVDQHNESKDWSVALLQNSARPSGALVAENDLTDEQIERMRGEMQRKDIGSRNAGGAMLLEGGLKWVQMSMKPTDIDWANGMAMSAREMSIVMRTPPELLFDSENKVFSSYREARKAYFEEAVLPDVDYLRDELNSWLAPLFDENIELDYDRDAIEALQDDREALWNSVGNAWWLTLNQKRRKLGLDDIENGDVLLLPASLIAVTPDKLNELSNRVLESVGQAVQGEIGKINAQNNER